MKGNAQYDPLPFPPVVLTEPKMIMYLLLVLKQTTIYHMRTSDGQEEWMGCDRPKSPAHIPKGSKKHIKILLVPFVIVTLHIK